MEQISKAITWYLSSNTNSLSFYSLLQTIYLLCEPGHEKMYLMSYANNKGADHPAHARSLISAFVVRCVDNIISLDSIAESSRLRRSVCVWPGRKLPKTHFVVSLLIYLRIHIRCTCTWLCVLTMLMGHADGTQQQKLSTQCCYSLV